MYISGPHGHCEEHRNVSLATCGTEFYLTVTIVVVFTCNYLFSFDTDSTADDSSFVIVIAVSAGAGVGGGVLLLLGATFVLARIFRKNRRIKQHKNTMQMEPVNFG